MACASSYDKNDISMQPGCKELSIVFSLKESRKAHRTQSTLEGSSVDLVAPPRGPQPYSDTSFPYFARGPSSIMAWYSILGLYSLLQTNLVVLWGTRKRRFMNYTSYMHTQGPRSSRPATDFSLS